VRPLIKWPHIKPQKIRFELRDPIIWSSLGVGYL